MRRKKLRLSSKIAQKTQFFETCFFAKIERFRTFEIFFCYQKKIVNVQNRSIFAKKHVSKNWVFWAILGKVLVFFRHIQPDGRLKHLATFIMAILLAPPPKPVLGRGRGRIKAGRGRTQTGRGRGMTGGIARARFFVLF